MRFLLCAILVLFPYAAFCQTAAETTDAVVAPQAGVILDRAAPNGVSSVPLADRSEITVLPEVSQAVEMSNTAYNRFKCDEVIQDVIPSEQKLLDVVYKGNSAFVKFKYVVKGGKSIYATKPLEMSIVCAGDIFHIIAVPRPLASSPNIRLSSGKKKQIEKNASLFGGLAHEKKGMTFIKLAYRDDIPDSFERSYPNTRFDLFKGLGITLRRVVTASGEGLTLKEYEISNKTKDVVKLKEKAFLLPELISNPVGAGVSLSKLNLKPGDTARLFIVERTGGSREQDRR